MKTIDSVNMESDLAHNEQARPERGVQYRIRPINGDAIDGVVVVTVTRSDVDGRLVAQCSDGVERAVSGTGAFVLMQRPLPRRASARR